jgi:hypothetical protein
MLIGLHGRKQAGKDTFYERAAHIMADVTPVERASFADLLYRSAAASLGLTVEELQKWKSDPAVRVQVVLLSSWSEDCEILVDITVRQYLQNYGTEGHREIFGSDFWVEQVRLLHEGRIVMVTDVRFENEAIAIQAAGGNVVCIEGPPEVEHADDGHASEVPLPEHLIDAWVDNSVRDDNFRAIDRQVDTLLRLHLNAQHYSIRMPA